MKKARGITPTEQWLAFLCEKTFLRLWSYPNLYREPGKELCDLLVVSGNRALIFSVKHCHRSDLAHAPGWRRWFGRTVIGGTKQLAGSRRWIREFPGRIFLDAACKRAFPLSEGLGRDTKFHLVCVALGAHEQCLRLTGSGCVPIDTGLSVNECVGERCTPLVIGDVRARGQFVHVFNETACELVLAELNTLSDLIAYLEAKETLAGGRRIIAPETDLLASYVRTGIAHGKPGFDVDPASASFEPTSGLWQDFCNGDKYRAKKEADRVSFLWDRIIDHFGDHVLGDTMETEGDVWELEKALRVMAAEPRLHRRALAQGLKEKLEEPVEKDFTTRVSLSPPVSPRFAYAFMVHRDATSQESERRRKLLAGYCMTLRTRFPDLEAAIGLSFDASSSAPVDLVHVGFQDWSRGDQERFDGIRKAMGFRSSEELIVRAQTEFEYPAE